MPTSSLQPGSSTPYHAVPFVSHNSRLAPLSHPSSSRRFTTLPPPRPAAAFLLLALDSCSHCRQHSSPRLVAAKPAPIARNSTAPARDIQSSVHYRYLLACTHRPRHRLAHPPLPGAPHCQLLIKSISPLSRVTSRFLPINSLIPLTNFGNPKSHLSPLSCRYQLSLSPPINLDLH